MRRTISEKVGCSMLYLSVACIHRHTDRTVDRAQAISCRQASAFSSYRFLSRRILTGWVWAWRMIFRRTRCATLSQPCSPFYTLCIPSYIHQAFGTFQERRAPLQQDLYTATPSRSRIHDSSFSRPRSLINKYTHTIPPIINTLFIDRRKEGI